VEAGGTCSGPTAPPTTAPTTQPPATNCSNAPEWSVGGVYNAGTLVTHEKSANGDPSGPPSGQGKHLWKAKWWTQGSEPGWTQQWEDQGRC
jgi:chitodextrinase